MIPAVIVEDPAQRGERWSSTLSEAISILSISSLQPRIEDPDQRGSGGAEQQDELPVLFVTLPKDTGMV